MEPFDNSGLPGDDKNEFQKQYEQSKLPADLEDRVVKELKNRNQFRIHLFQKLRWLRPAFFTLLLVISFFVGYYVNDHKTSALSSSSSAASPYLLLLSNPPGFAQSASHAAEYGAWFKNLHDKNAQGDELKNESWTIQMKDNSVAVQPTVAVPNPISGYFIINAPSDNEALSIASGCPHIRHNGIVTVRPVKLYQQ